VLSLALAAGSVLALATTAALGQDDPVVTVPDPTDTTTTRDEVDPDEEEFGRDFEDREPDPEPTPREEDPPPEQQESPTRVPAPPTAAPRTAPLPRTGWDTPAIVAAAFWILLGGVVLRRVTAQRVLGDEPWAPWC